MYLSSYDPQSQPLFHFKGYPVRLAMLLVAIHCVAMIAGAVVGDPAAQFLGLSAGRFDDTTIWPKWWQWGTYFINHGPGVGFLIGMYFLWQWGSIFETTFGRKSFGILYTVLWLLPSVLGSVFLALGLTPGVVLVGAHYAHFCLFMSMAFMHPDAPFFCTPIKLWFVAFAVFVVYLLQDISNRYWLGCVTLTANVAATYFLMRRWGLSARFTRVSEAVSAAMPQRKQKAAPRPYEPKVRPKPEISPEMTPVAKIDAILEKISRSGIDSLDEWERRELDRASKELKRLDQ